MFQVAPSRSVLVVSVALAALLLPAAAGPALADGGSGSCSPTYVEHLGPACRRGDGLYEVFLADGTTLLTHGPDPIPAGQDPGFATDALQRPPVCAESSRIHVLYGHPGSAEDRSDEVGEDLRDIVERMNALLYAEGIASGQTPTDYKVRCDAKGEIAIGTFAGPDTGGTAYTDDFAAVVDAARQAGFDEKGTNYLIFYDDGSAGVCGVANNAQDDRPSEDNENLVGPDYGVTYESCWSGRTPMHENAHTMGAVQRLAPMSDGSGHCLEGEDVMCYPTQDVLQLCTDRVRFDCNHDTYFDTAPEEGSWLAGHWNLGDPLNTYLAFDEPRLPVPAISVACQDLRCTLDGSDSQDPDGDIEAYRWQLGDETTAEGQRVAVTYGEAGSYEIELEVIDSDDLAARTTAEVTVTAAEHQDQMPATTIVANFTVDCQGFNCTFDASPSKVPSGEVTYRWSLGQAANATGRKVDHTFDATGVYAIELNVTGPQGGTDAIVKDLTLSLVEKEQPSDENLTENRVVLDRLAGSAAGLREAPLPGTLTLAAVLSSAVLIGRRRG